MIESYYLYKYISYITFFFVIPPCFYIRPQLTGLKSGVTITTYLDEQRLAHA